jgi:AraC-like DNA-binding protein
MALASLYLWNSQALYLGQSDTEAHRHHALAISVGINSTFKVKAGLQWKTYRALITSASLPHRFDGRGGTQLVIVMEPELEIARRLKQRLLGNKFIAELDYALFHPLVNELENVSSLLTCVEARKLFGEIVLALLDKDMPAHEMNPHVQGALELIRDLPIKKVSLTTIADGVHLSQSRFVTLFKKNVGVPFRRYLMWQRLLEAVKQVTSGASLTEAAHESGFADSAHLSRTFKQMFGMTMAEVFKNSQFIQVNSCL